MPKLHPIVLALATLLFWGRVHAAHPSDHLAIVDSAPASPAVILKRAFDLRYGCSQRGRVRMVVEDNQGQGIHRTMELISKEIDGQLHGLGHLTEPARLRGVMLLMIENRQRSDDYFLYLPAIRRVRRVSSSQRADAFMGTDVTYADFERQRAESYEIQAKRRETVAGENAYVIAGRPRVNPGFARAEFLVAASDLAILMTRYFKRDADQPYKLIYSPRESIEAHGDCLIPMRLRVEDLQRGTRTTVKIEDLEVNPELDDRLFSVTELEKGPALLDGRGR